LFKIPQRIYLGVYLPESRDQSLGVFIFSMRMHGYHNGSLGHLLYKDSISLEEHIPDFRPGQAVNGKD
jgi:hypothetical protein